MAISAAQVKELRQRTGCGMMECKKALVETNGDIEAAIEAMRTAFLALWRFKVGIITVIGACAAAGLGWSLLIH